MILTSFFEILSAQFVSLRQLVMSSCPEAMTCIWRSVQCVCDVLCCCALFVKCADGLMLFVIGGCNMRLALSIFS